MTTNTDQELIEKTLRGETAAFGQLVKRYESYVFTIVIRMVKNRVLAEEVSQDTFLKAYESLSSFRGDSKFSSWLYRIAYRKALDQLRKNKKHQTMELVEDISEGKMGHLDDALNRLETKERTAKIQACLMELPEDETALITLYYYEELSVKEIAEITKLTSDNIKIKLYRARKKLFASLGRYILPQIANDHGTAI